MQVKEIPHSPVLIVLLVKHKNQVVIIFVLISVHQWVIYVTHVVRGLGGGRRTSVSSWCGGGGGLCSLCWCCMSTRCCARRCACARDVVCARDVALGDVACSRDVALEDVALGDVARGDVACTQDETPPGVGMSTSHRPGPTAVKASLPRCVCVCVCVCIPTVWHKRRRRVDHCVGLLCWCYRVHTCHVRRLRCFQVKRCFLIVLRLSIKL